MNYEELRVGNWIDFKSTPGKYEMVKDITTSNGEAHISINRISGDDIIPIKITESNTAGFNVTKLKNIIDVLQIVRSEPLVVPQVFYIMMTLAGKLKLKIEYVHQLQNLYLDITGEYLEWTPEKERSKLTVV